MKVLARSCISNSRLDATFALLKARLTEGYPIPEDALLFIEDEDGPIDEAVLVKDRATATGLKSTSTAAATSR